MSFARGRWGLAGPILALMVAACCPAQSPPQPQSAPAVEASGHRDRVEALADRLLARARGSEPEVTPLLLELAAREGGELVKLEHRLKTKRSTVRKINKELAENPDLSIDDVVIDDALRYTMRLEDEPEGHYLAAVRRVLDSLREAGHRVVELKNYWPTGDNYSGINTVLETSDGILWELQFHTTESLAVQERTRDQYEELRRLDTPLARKRELFDSMTRAWDTVDVPSGVLQPGATHPKQELRQRPRP